MQLVEKFFGALGAAAPGSLVRLRRHICRNDNRFVDPACILQPKKTPGIVKGRSP